MLYTFSIPVRTIFEPHDGGVVALAMTEDAKYLAMLSAGQPQVIRSTNQVLSHMKIECKTSLLNYQSSVL